MKTQELLPDSGNNFTSRQNSSLLYCKIAVLFNLPCYLAFVSSSRLTPSLKSVTVPLFIAVKMSSEHSPGSEYLGIQTLVHTHHRCHTGIAFLHFSMLLKIKWIGYDEYRRITTNKSPFHPGVFIQCLEEDPNTWPKSLSTHFSVFPVSGNAENWICNLLTLWFVPPAMFNLYTWATACYYY